MSEATNPQTTPSPNSTEQSDPRDAPRAPFRRVLGDYPLRSRQPAALLTLRAPQTKPIWGRKSGCAFAINKISDDPRTRKQAMAEDRL
eukprot:4075665-Pleurochrysis_carterae.AAC.1